MNSVECVTDGDALPILACELPPFCLIHQHKKSHLCSSQRHRSNGLLFILRNLIQGAFSPLLGLLLPSTHIYKIPRSRTQAKYVLLRFDWIGLIPYAASLLVFLKGLVLGGTLHLGTALKSLGL